MSATLDDHQRLWDRYAASDPLWAVLSDPSKKDRQWSLDEFMKNGEREISLLFYQLEGLRLAVRRGSAMDFGSGVGRLTQALARRFAGVVGVDISPRMVEIASRLNRYPGVAEYRCNPHPDLRDFPSATLDFLYSNIVLQHIPPEIAVVYVAEFLRLLNPGGVAVFQLPSHLDPRPKAVFQRMPDSAYRASLTLASAPPTAVAPATDVTIALQVRNASAEEWRQADAGSIRVGNHWLDAAGRVMLIQDDGRAVLPQVLRAGDSAMAMITMRAPAQEGTFCAEIDLVHEGVSWFHDKGSPTLRFDVQVRSHAASASALRPAAAADAGPPAYSAGELERLYENLGPPSSPDPFPMYGVPQAQVLSLIRAHGGTLVHVEDDGYGAEWIGYRYFVRK